MRPRADNIRPYRVSGLSGVGVGMRTEKEIQRLNILRIFILAFAAISIIYGVVRGETEAVLRKAASICLECIGIG